MRRTFLHTAVAVLVLGCVFGAQAQPTGRLNDTGLTRCIQDNTYVSQCDGTGQDADYGRDSTHRNSNDGVAGFSFVKISSTGEELPASAKKWDCVLDRVTGLMWEIKTNDGPRAKNRFIPAAFVDSYAFEVNSSGLCSHTDWRVPTIGELYSIFVHRSRLTGLAIDRDFFPRTNDNPGFYLSTTLKLNTGGNARWGVDFSYGNGITFGQDAYPVRLVRGTPPSPPQRFIPLGDEVLDSVTGLIWKRCADGLVWNGSQCSGVMHTSYTLFPAIERARTEAQATGLAWRVPNAKELVSLVDFSTVNPAIDTVAFPQTPRTVFISATTAASYVWFIQFESGGSSHMPLYDSGALRMVRDGAAVNTNHLPR